jgi:CRISPR/Cas system-associated exonuclease Cas4 (RecB family)
MKQPTHLSFSQIKSFRDCPRSWYVQKILGEEQPPSEAASKGSQFDQMIAHKLVGAERPVDLLDRIEEAADTYLLSKHGWKHADEAQRKIELNPTQWEVLADSYGVSWPLPLPIVGYVDLFRKTEDGFRIELCDLKTSERAEYRSDWSLQGSLYSLVERAYKFEVHLVTWTKQLKVVKYEYRPTEQTFRWCMNVIGETASRMSKVSRSTSAESIPATPGFWCRWCPRQTNCEGSLVGVLTACE